MAKKFSTSSVLVILVVLGVVALEGALFGEWGLTLPFLVFGSGVLVGKMNGEDVTK